MIRAAFVGIGRFTDPAASELRGCVRDATALHALFLDSIAPSEIDARLLIDEAASANAIRSALRETLEVATSDDAVVLTFATHGTPNHYLVAYDTNAGDLSGTAIAMTELAEAFQRSRARQILLILDACFGGAAPARVVEVGSMSRDFLDLSAFAGQGRLIISASAWHQPCFEHPKRRHGLLSEALIEALLGDEDLSALTLVDRVVARVRFEAEKLGEVQDPTVAGSVEGALALPRLRRGAAYDAAFPEYRAVRVTSVNDLERFDIPPMIVAAWSERFQNRLHELQLDAINDRRVLDGDSLFVVAPTSSGKTFIGEMAAARAVAAGRKAVFLLPFKALTNEKYDEFTSFYGEKCGMRVIRCTGDFNDDVTTFVAGRYDIALLTYEMFLGLTVRNAALLYLIDLIVVDEAQFIGDPSRGITVELILTMLRSFRERGIQPQLVLLSATVSNLNNFDAWLALDALMTDHRPVPLDVGVLDRTGTYEYLSQDGTTHLLQLLPAGVIKQRKQKPSSQDLLVPLIQKLTQDPHETIIVFRNRRGSAQGCAEYLAAEAAVDPAPAAIAALPLLDTSSASSQLRISLNGGVAFHTTNLNRDEKQVVEQYFRRGEGIRVLVGTSGVGAGINTPASTVIIAETTWAAPENPAMSVGDVRNMAGRAGRVGYQAAGRAIILADTPIQRHLLFQRYVQSHTEPLRSSFATGNIGTWTLRLLAQIGGMSRVAIGSMIANTYGGYLLTRTNAAVAGHVAEQSIAYVDRFIELGLAREQCGRVELTDLGRACGGTQLSIESCLQVLSFVRSLRPLSSLQLLGLTQALSEMDDHYIPMQSRGAGESQWIGVATSQLGVAAEALRQRQDSVLTVARRSKRFLIAAAWAEGAEVSAIEKRYSANPFFAIGHGDIAGVADASRFRLASVYAIAAIATPETVPDLTAFENFLARLEYGIPEALVPLLRISGLRRGDLLAIGRLAVRSPEDLWALPATALAQLPEELVHRIERQRPLDVANDLKTA